MNLPPPFDDPRLLAAAAVALLVVFLLFWTVRRRRRRSLPERLRRATLDMLRSIVVPDGEGGQMPIDYVLLTPGGIIVLDLRDVAGHVFGSNTMQDWTVLAERRRFTFANPQHALHDRVAVMRRLLPEVTVRGIVAFTHRAQFNKGLPEHVALVEDLLAELKAGAGDQEASGLRDAWDRLRREAVSAQVGRLMSD